MCSIVGIRIKCACKDARCRSRTDFIDRDPRGNTIRHPGHGWHHLTRRLGSHICRHGRRMLDSGEMRWLDARGRVVEWVVPHPGITVEWEYQEPSSGQPGRICDECRESGHQVA